VFEVVSFSTPHPAQFVTGKAGTCSTRAAVAVPAGTTPAPGAVVASLVAANRFGFMTMQRDGARGGWSRTTLAACR